MHFRQPGYCRRINVQKLDDIFYCRAELGRPEAEAGICTADERYIPSAPIAKSNYVKAVI